MNQKYLLIIFLVLFLIIFIIDFFLIKKPHYKVKKKRNKKKNNDLTEISYLTSKFKLTKSKLINNKILAIISLINAFIISIVSIVVIKININIILQLLIGFFLLIALIYSIYEILGRILVKKGYDKNDN